MLSLFKYQVRPVALSQALTEQNKLSLFPIGLNVFIFPQVWRSNLDRDHPDTIKRRFVSAAFMTIVSPVFVWKFGAGHLSEKYSLMDLIGLRTPGTHSN